MHCIHTVEAESGWWMVWMVDGGWWMVVRLMKVRDLLHKAEPRQSEPERGPSVVPTHFPHDEAKFATSLGRTESIHTRLN